MQRGPLLNLRLARQVFLQSLGPMGWCDSVRRGYPVNREGAPLPWFTYPSIAFLEPRIDPSWSVFEFGAGQSTLWWAQRAGRVFTCEHDQVWYDRIRNSVPSNVQLVRRDLDAGYVDAAAEHKGHDVIVIDGRRRNDCAARSIVSLNAAGIIIWDNSERLKYKPGLDHLRVKGFRHVDFVGLGPVNAYPWQTTIFYRSDNCLGI